MWTPSGGKNVTTTAHKRGFGWRIAAIVALAFVGLISFSGTQAYAGGNTGSGGNTATSTATTTKDSGNHYGTLFVLCQKVGEAPGWKIVVSQNNDANNQNRFLLDTTTGISVQDARDKYDATACNKFNPPPVLVDVHAVFPDGAPATCTADATLPATPVTKGIVYSWTGNTLKAAAAEGYNLLGTTSRTYELAKATGYQSTNAGAACYKAPEVATPVVTSPIPDVIPSDGITPWYGQVGTWIGFGVGGFVLLIIFSAIGRIRVRRGTTTEA